MALESLHDLLVHELKDLYSAERQLVQALPKMAKAATSTELQEAFTQHLEETKEHVTRLEEVLEGLGESTRGPKCKGMEGIIEEGKSLLEEDADEAVLDAGMIAAAQRVEHYEIAAYGCVCEYARVLGHDDAVALLQQTLDEEQQANDKLTSLAEGGLNALAEEQDDEEGEEEDEEATETASSRSSRSTSKAGGRSGTSKRR